MFGYRIKSCFSVNEVPQVVSDAMVMLRSSSSGTDEAAATKRPPPDMDSSSEFLSLRRPLRKSARLKRGLDDSCSSAENSPANVSFSFKRRYSGIRENFQ